MTEKTPPRYVVAGPYGMIGTAMPGYLAAETVAEAERLIRTDMRYFDRFVDVAGQPNGEPVSWALMSGDALLDGTWDYFDDGAYNLNGAMADGYPLCLFVVGPRGGLNREAC